MAEWEAIEAEYHRRAKEAQAELAAWLAAAMNEDEVPSSREAVLEEGIERAISYLVAAQRLYQGNAGTRIAAALKALRAVK